MAITETTKSTYYVLTERMLRVICAQMFDAGESLGLNPTPDTPRGVFEKALTKAKAKLAGRKHVKA